MRKMYLGLLVMFCLSLYGQVAQAATFSTYPPKGTIHNAQVVYKDADEVTIQAGYGECNGKYWEITAATDLSVATVISGVAGGNNVYIYIDDSASYYPTPTLVGSLDEPVWSDTKQGWYRQSIGNEDDRMIGVIYIKDTATLMNTDWVGGNKYFVTPPTLYVTLQTNGNPNGTWQDTSVNAANYLPVNAIGAYVYANNRDADSTCTIAVSSYDNYGQSVTEYTWGDGYCRGWLYGKRGWSRRFKWFGADNDDNLFLVRIQGYEIDR